MTYLERALERESFKRALKLSAALHLIFLVVSVLGAKFAPALWDFLFPRPSERIVRSSVKVDLLALPQKTLKELRALNNEAVSPKSAPKEKVGRSVKKRSASDLDFKKAKDKEKKKIHKKEGEDGLDFEGVDLDGLVKRGNILSEGTDLIGDKADAEYGELESYESKLPAHVRPYWRLPSHLYKIRDELRARVRVKIRPNGEVIVELLESSGNKEYDQLAVEAVKRSAPFPAVPSLIRLPLLRGDVVLGFPL